MLGPLTLEQYLDFLPNGSAYQAAVRFDGVFFAAGDRFELQLILRREETPGMVLQEESSGFMLGWTTWIKNVADDSGPG